MQWASTARVMHMKLNRRTPTPGEATGDARTSDSETSLCDVGDLIKCGV